MSRATLTRGARLATAGLAAAVAVAMPYAATHAVEPDPPRTTAGQPAPDTASPQHRQIVSLMRHMSLQQKIGQLFVIEVYGRDANNVSDAAKAGNQKLYGVDTPAQAIAKYQPGGVIYFTTRGPDNIGDATQVATLSNGLQTAALQQRPKIPLNIAVDQEGGALVARFGPASGATQMPGQMALGADGSTADAARSAEVIGTELAAVGVTQDYAPVADVNLNPNNPVIGIRSAGADSAAVSDIVAAEVGGFDKGGLSSIAKHFPGHGDTGTDSHYGLPEVTHTREQLEAIDLPPFEAAIDAGIDAIMTAHVTVPAIDPSGEPATMSEPILTGLLREEMGFNGLIVTDALDMQGASATYPPDVAPVEAFLAGADQLLIPPQMDTAYAAVLGAVKNGTISRQRLDESVYRILKHKLDNKIFESPYVDPAAAPAVFADPVHKADAQAISDRTTTLVKNDDGLLPLAPGPKDVLVAGWGVDTTAGIAAGFQKRGATTQVLQSGTTPTDAQIDAAVAAAAGKDLVVVPTNNAWQINPATGQPTPASVAQTKLVKALLATDTPVVVTAMRNPYDVTSFPEAATVLDTYGYTSHQLESLVRVLHGEVNPSGKLPVEIPDLFPLGHGLSY
ncbi:glycoside hydrolase family 3 protein [Nocardioides sp. WG-D5]|uniref:glycoside hydrolase family 3 protein n=1 Tax=Nocardioides luteus TaxID=1844 RepID=UPI0002028F5E|nr:glycoside hydrolase family 3 protein [Nocardioides luteus]EGD43257.1 putative beta-N-Acetylglucosaminidase [Nocardioidaceae bacterium Broad-1]MBG6097948.1 beta-N-acetylhexosaminidase [Nocardioides luteus]